MSDSATGVTPEEDRRRTLRFAVVALLIVGLLYIAYYVFTLVAEPRGAVASDLYAATGIHFATEDRIERYWRRYGRDRSDFWKLNIVSRDRFERIRYSTVFCSQQRAWQNQQDAGMWEHGSRHLPSWWKPPAGQSVYRSYASHWLTFDDGAQVIYMYTGDM